MKTHIDFLKSAERWKSYGENYLNNGIGAWSEFIKSMLTLSTFLLGFNVIWIQIQKPPYTNDQKYLIAGMFASLTFSALFGVWNMYKSNVFLNKSGRYYEKLSEELTEYIRTTGEMSGDKYPDNIKFKSNKDYDLAPWQFTFQIVSLGIGILTTAILGAFFLLK